MNDDCSSFKKTIVGREYLSPPFHIVPPLKKSLISLFPILFFQTLNLVMLTALAKSQGKRGASYKSALLVSCLTISHTCLPCLPSGMVSHCVPGFTEVRSCCYSRKWVWTFCTILCPFNTLITWKMKILTLKKLLGDIIILHICTMNDNHMMYGS